MKKTPSSNEILISSMMGNALEWYDFVIYGYFAVTIGTLFFPTFSPFAQALASWGVFWLGFFARPLGSLIFGHYGDKIGRKFALTLSIYVMVIPTVLVGFLPTYAQIGLLAPIILFLLRFIQGIALGGESTGSLIFLVEHAKPEQRCLWGSMAHFSVVMGVIVGSLVVAAFSSFLSEQSMMTWGWRLPFIFSIVGGGVAAYIRQKLVDPHVFLEIKEIKKITHTPIRPIHSLVEQHKAQLGHIILLDILDGVGFYMVAIFLATYFKTYLHISGQTTFIVNTFNMFVLAFFIFLGGFLADKVGRKIVLGLPCIFLIIFSYPLFLIAQSATVSGIMIMQTTLSILLGLFLGAIATTIAEMMPMSVRYTGVSVGHSIAMVIFGGGTPFITTFLLKETNNLLSPAFLLIAAAFLSLIAAYFVRD